MSFTTDQTRLIIEWLNENRGLLSDAISWHIDSTTRPAPTVDILAGSDPVLPAGVTWGPEIVTHSDEDGHTLKREAVLHDSKDFRVIMCDYRTITAFDPLKPAEQVAS